MLSVMLSARKDMMLPVLESRLLRIAYVSAKPVTILSCAFAHALSGFLKTPPDLYEHLHPFRMKAAVLDDYTFLMPEVR